MSKRHILLISGPSGGGKTTFLRQLREGTLAPEILARLPADSGNRPVLEANDVLKGKPVMESLPAGTDGVALHYDIVLMHRYRIERYEDDPSLDLLDGAESLDVVFVRPDTALVKRNFMNRQNEHRKKKSNVSLLWSRFVRLPMRCLLSPITGKPTQSTEDVYQDDNWLAGCYRRWETFIGSLVERQPNAHLIVVEPAGEGETFRLHTA
jgi:hypothetical protein